MRRKRRSRGTWFPVLGTNPETTESFAQFNMALDNPVGPANQGRSITGIIPLTYDQPQESGNDPTADTLVEIVGNEYLLQRIVGKIYVWLPAKGSIDDGVTNQQPGVQVTCGFFVARANDPTEAGGQDLPIGANVGSIVKSQYRVDAVETIREPWIWRRSWILGNPVRRQMTIGASDQSSGGVMLMGTDMFPPTNVGYGDMASGPFLDARSKRRVKLDERLWFAATSRVIFGSEDESGTEPAQSLTTRICVDARLFGSLRKARNSGNF